MYPDGQTPGENVGVARLVLKGVGRQSSFVWGPQAMSCPSEPTVRSLQRSKDMEDTLQLAGGVNTVVKGHVGLVMLVMELELEIS